MSEQKLGIVVFTRLNDVNSYQRIHGTDNPTFSTGKWNIKSADVGWEISIFITPKHGHIPPIAQHTGIIRAKIPSGKDGNGDTRYTYVVECVNEKRLLSSTPNQQGNKLRDKIARGACHFYPINTAIYED